MAMQVHRPAWISKGWMSFTVTTGNVLHLGGALQTTPTAAMAVAADGTTKTEADTTACFLYTGIPQNLDKTSFADVANDRGKDPRGHSIKHAIIEIISVAGATLPAARSMQDGSIPTTDHGRYRRVGDAIEFNNSRQALFGFKIFNNSGGNMLVEVEVFE